MKFSEQVYNALKKVPKGKITTYKHLAQAVNSKAYRAIGTLMRKNPHAPIVPCHRVVNSNGNLGNYAHGQEMKIQRLKKEGIQVINKKIVNFEKLLHNFQ